MSYIAYFDLIGTKGFCESSDLYFKKINSFKDAIKQLSVLLKGEGKVGVFSDCSYVESKNLQCLLDFLVQLRDRLISKELFFNAVIKKGELKAETLNKSDYLFGVAFNDSCIADLYIQQVNFKGIGILVDSSVQEDVQKTGYRMTDCIYIQKKTINNVINYYPVAYKDISFGQSVENKKTLEILLRVVLNVMFSSYMKSPKYGTYYVSVLSNLVRSYGDDFKWDMKTKKFITIPLTFQVVDRILCQYYDKMIEFQGLEYLAFILLDVIYNSESLNEEEKISITNQLSEYTCVKNKYLHSLDDIPNNLFSMNPKLNVNNRELFIKYCQEDLSSSFVEKVLDSDN